MENSGWHRRVRAAGLVLAIPQYAHAHLITTGVGPFYDGMVHFFVSIEEVLPVLALALFGGLRGPRAGRWAMTVLPIAWLAGGFAGLTAPINTPPALATTVLLLVPGVLLASDWDLPCAAVVVLAVLFGLWAGFLNGSAMGAAGLGTLGVIGTATTTFLVTTFSAALAVLLRSGWTRIVLRVVGSWLAALGVLSVWT